MQKEFIAKSVEEARAAAAAEFGVAEEKITFVVIEEPKKGFLGKVKGEAKVSAEYNPPSKAEAAAQYLKEILINMGISEAEVNVTEDAESATLDIVGDTTGAIIGRRGETLDALQYLASMVCNRNDKDYYRITVDSCGYREKRKAILEDLAKKISRTVIKTGRTSALEPMNPYERRIIHSTVSAIEGVTSRSTGEEPYRKVIISSTEKRPEGDRPRSGGFRRVGAGGGRGNDRRGGGRPPRNNDRGDFKPRNRTEGPRSLDLSTSFEKDYKKPKPEDSLEAGLYGKIDI